MASVGDSSGRHPTNFLCACLLLVILSEVALIVDGCKNWEQCLTVSECRNIQKKNNIQVGRMSDFSFVFPCDESLKVMTICCTVQQPGQEATFEQHPGYNITYGDPEASPSEPVPSPEPLPLPLRDDPSEGLQKVASREDEECGLLRGGGGGEGPEGDALTGPFPWLALLGKCDHATGELLVDCGGSLINNRYILTSAYCLDNLKAAPEIVRIGDFDQTSEEFMSNGFPQQYDIEKIIVHERFNYPFLKNDIALVRLKTPIPQFSDWLRPICLPEGPSEFESTEYIISGRRIPGSREVLPNTIPQFGPLSLSNSGLCDLPIPLQPLGETQMCFGSNPSSCFGEFGGPLIEVIKTGTPKRAVQAAIYSYGGSNCNAKFSADLYTMVFPFRDWITKNIEA